MCFAVLLRRPKTGNCRVSSAIGGGGAGSGWPAGFSTVERLHASDKQKDNRDMRTLFVLTLLAAASVFAQGELQVFRGSLVAATPAAGRIALLSDSLVFIDEEMLASSFVVLRSNIQVLTADADSVTIQLNKDVKDRAGLTTRVILKLSAAPEAVAMQRWFASQPVAAAPAAPKTTVMSFGAQRNKRLRGKTDGKLIIDDQRIMFESVDKAEDSQRWDLKDIKELKHKNAYELEIKPFVGDTYVLMITGSGMDNSQFREITDRVTRSRTAR